MLSEARMNKPTRSPFWLVLLALILVGVAALLVGFVWQPWQHGSVTKRHLFDPAVGADEADTTSLTKALEQEFSRVVTDHGTCAAGSESGSLGATARCMAPDYVYDPCFGSGPHFVCVSSPWASAAIVFNAPEPLNAASSTPPRLGNVKTTHAWAVELTNGARCLMVQGAHDSFGGIPVDYLCSRGRHALGSIVGWPDGSRSLWGVAYLAPGHKSTMQVDVSDAWF
jgi:hypothetical protein